MSKNSKSLNRNSPIKHYYLWRTLQTILFIVGGTILFTLMFYPSLGLHLFWNILIPIAPFLFVISVGIWRNLCPLASVALLPRHMRISKRKKLSQKHIDRLNLGAVSLLFLVVPLRHAILNLSGPWTAFVLVLLAISAFFLGFVFEWKSAWCSGLCPIHPVEKLYGQRSFFTLNNAHCNLCHKCITPCPDSVLTKNVYTSSKSAPQKIINSLMIGAFPGFIWGWFQTPDVNGISNLWQLIDIYGLPFWGSICSIIVVYILNNIMNPKTVARLSASLAISLYYWFRVPALFGFGKFPQDGLLYDLRNWVPRGYIFLLTALLILFFFWHLVFRNTKSVSWLKRPEYAK